VTRENKEVQGVAASPPLMDPAGRDAKRLAASHPIANAAAFTPGPWIYDEGSDSVASLFTLDDGGDIICSSPGAEKSEARWPANRALIAAAPDLYEALTECVKRLRRCAMAGGNAPFAVDALCEQFEAPLAKARNG
jgi:hypothetical protein